MVRLQLIFKSLAFLAVIGLFCAALIMMTEGFLRIGQAIKALVLHESGHNIVVSVMSATDEFLFAVVLGLMAAAILCNFVLTLSDEAMAALPKWLVFHDISHVKHTLVELILVYLIVNFATDVAEAEHASNWGFLVMPAAILALAGAARIMKT